jgi:hemin uptake protein HemP
MKKAEVTAKPLGSADVTTAPHACFLTDQVESDGTAQGEQFVFTPAHRNAGQPVRRISSAHLFGNSQEIEIEHGGSCYRLRQTALGKLIMTK